SVSETVCRRVPLTTSRTAWARRKTRASFVCFNTVSKAERASLGKWSWRVRMALLFSLKYYKNTKICHDIVQLFSYQSKPFQLEFSRSCSMSQNLRCTGGSTCLQRGKNLTGGSGRSRNSLESQLLCQITGVF